MHVILTIYFVKELTVRAKPSTKCVTQPADDGAGIRILTGKPVSLVTLRNLGH
jgi:hypothetical protein